MSDIGDCHNGRIGARVGGDPTLAVVRMTAGGYRHRFIAC